MTRFDAAKARKAELEARSAAASAVLNAFPKGAMGLTPDAVKFSPEFRAAKRAFDTAFEAERRFNRWFLKEFASEVRAERRARG